MGQKHLEPRTSAGCTVSRKYWVWGKEGGVFYTVLWRQELKLVEVLEATISDQWRGFPAGHPFPVHPVPCKLLGLRSSSFTGSPHWPAHYKCISATGLIAINVPLPSRPTESIRTSSVLTWHAPSALWAWLLVRWAPAKKQMRHLMSSREALTGSSSIHLGKLLLAGYVRLSKVAGMWILVAIEKMSMQHGPQGHLSF